MLYVLKETRMSMESKFRRKQVPPWGQSYKANFDVNYIKNGFNKLNFALNYINMHVIYIKLALKDRPQV